MSTYGKINNFHMKHFFELFRLVISFFKDSSSIYISSLFTIFFFNSLSLSLSYKFQFHSRMIRIIPSSTKKLHPERRRKKYNPSLLLRE